jgi:hypothetical protein
MEHMNITLEHKGHSASGDSDTGSCTEAPYGAAGWDPVKQRAGETPLTGEEHQTPSSPISGNPEGLTEKVGALGLRVARNTVVVLPKSGRGRQSLWRLLLGTLAVADLDPPEAASHRHCKGPAHLELHKNKSQLQPD